MDTPPRAPETIITQNEEETAMAAARFAKILKGREVVLLDGAVGTGKSVFARALIRALTHPAMEVPSPTFSLVQIYETARGPLWHFDLYRLKSPDDLYELGWEEAYDQAILVIEWPERMDQRLTPRAIRFTFRHGANPNERSITHAHPA